MANKVKTIFANMSWLMVSQILTSVLAFVWTILMARYLGPTNYGIFGSAVSLTSLEEMASSLGSVLTSAFSTISSTGF